MPNDDAIGDSPQTSSSEEGKHFRSVQNIVHARGYTSLLSEDKKEIAKGFRSGKSAEAIANSIVGKRSRFDALVSAADALERRVDDFTKK